ncbi:glycosyltransferase [Flavobacterium sp.]|uniref:glycosyltransferase n=1 Tax=Flavobacterium sp. TaxID=239 RepID=UPI001B6AE1B9|nr:glycosyltransferase [Flavobacterium sp.]MBP6181224.1 glycosyltransferase [Flavobacterium sp.]
MTQIKVSVIIPVYNAEEFLVDCIQSLISQTLQECEFIFVNDGSVDFSQQIIEQFQKKDHRIILINQENKGISGARNTGVEVSKGAYIGFIDNDDYVKETMFETLYNNAIKNDFDIVVSKTILGRDGKHIIKQAVFPVENIYDQEFIQKNIIPSLLREEDLFAVWNKIYKRSLVFQNHVRFPKTRVIEEDNMFNIQAFNKASKVIFIDYSGYFYREVATSESRKTIENDYFEKALQKFHFDYKKEYNLSITYQELEKLKAIRFIQRVCYLVYKCAMVETSFDKKLDYIKNMVFHPTVFSLSNQYRNEILYNKGKYEFLVLKIIKNKSIVGLYLLVLSIKAFYHPKISETIRFLNNSRIQNT